MELEPLNYQFPGEVDNDWDGNWLMVRISAADQARHWSAADPAFLTWELRLLCRWLRSVADSSAGDDAVFTGIEPCLQFERQGLGAEARIRAFFGQEYTPPGMDRTSDPYEIDFTPGIEGMLSFADDLERSLARFPIRVLEIDGVAKHYVRELEDA